MARLGGVIPFSRYMDLALNAPGLGYYTAGAQKFGREGDFVTAPELSPLFSRCVARQVAEVLHCVSGGDVCEIGAGTGAMVGTIVGLVVPIAAGFVLLRHRKERMKERTEQQRCNKCGSVFPA